ncbi:MAG: magnesium transporter CorA family protein [Paracoccus sp. (in: a-proteobacteria)]|nr:magnesium transporter CorA family protein [Paracoccus sp. (in: a-proteobacteria)]
MLRAYIPSEGGLALLPPDANPGPAIWIDALEPTEAEAASLAALGIDVPTLEDMEEIEISNRLYHEGSISYMTATLPGAGPDGRQISAPVTFILGPARLVTVRHHTPRPFETYPARAGAGTPGCGAPDAVFLGLIEDIIARMADLLEQAGRALDQTGHEVFAPSAQTQHQLLQAALQRLGQQAELIARVRLALLSLERVLAFFAAITDGGAKNPMRQTARVMGRDVQALEVHLDFLSGRVGQTVDTTLGLIGLHQNNTVRILSAVAALFLPPTLIASIYGMNFAVMPELGWRLGYPMAILLMLASAALTYAFIRWKKWL